MERAKGENQTQYIDIGTIQPLEVVSFIDDNINRIREDLFVNTDEYHSDIEIYEHIGEIYEADFDETAISEDLDIAARILSVGSITAEENVDLTAITELSGEASEFCRGAAVAHYHLVSDMLKRGFNFYAHQEKIELPISRKLSKEGVISTECALGIAEEIYVDGQRYFSVYESYWRPVLEQHGQLFKSNAFELSYVESGIGHMIYIMRRSLVLESSRHNAKIGKREATKTRRKFKAQLSGVQSVEDLERYFRTD